MINLLTPEATCIIRRVYWLRVGTAWASVGVIAMAIAGVLLIPPYVLISSQMKVYQASATEAAEKIATYQSTSAALIEAMQQARWVVDTADQVSLMAILTVLEAALPSTVTLNSIVVSRRDEGLAPITISGVAETRRDVVMTEELLRALPQVTNVTLPVTNLTERMEVPFTMTVDWVIAL